MTDTEAKALMTRIAQFRELETVRNEMQQALNKITEPWTGTGPCDQGPFTGNTRESRQVQFMRIYFTPTRGGSPAVDIDIPNMHIEAYELGQALAAMLRKKIEACNEELAKI